jgi:ABC-type transport system involved in multi-copper enzyme maturation permease subunit
LLVGPIFSREATIAPRRPRFYVARAAYPAVLLVLTGTAWLVVTGTQLVRDVGDLARFGSLVFQILAALQLAVALFFSGLLAAGAAAQEKDRQTLVLLLLTNLTNAELVLGRLLASLLQVLVMLAAGAPVFMLAALLGGVSPAEIGRALAVTLVSVLACGSLGSTLALWREKTYQALAMTVLVLVLWLAAWEAVGNGLLGESPAGIPCETLAAGFSPWRAIREATRPYLVAQPELGPLGSPVHLYLVVGGLLTVLLNVVAIVRVRVWNPPRESAAARGRDETDRRRVGSAGVPPASAPTGQRPALRKGREVWDNPVLWREVRTWAYGRRTLLIRLAYLAVFAWAAAVVHQGLAAGPLTLGSTGTAALVGLCLLSLVLINTQAVTALCAERDLKALDLLLVSDLSPGEIVFGKLLGALYNAKEMVLLPMLLCGYLCYRGALGAENLVYLLGGLAVLDLFAAVVGLHAGMIYDNSPSAAATSLGTIFFLFVGVAVCMRMMVAFSGSFQAQLQPFLAFMLGGGVGLYLALGARNPSTAIAVASLACPFAMFYAITSFLLGQTLGVFLVVAGAYGFATAAMLVPALYEFDVATGRTTVEEG